MPLRERAWHGGFVLGPPHRFSRVAALDGTVVAGGEHVYRLRPGAIGFEMRPPPGDPGDITAVAVEPRLAGRAQRFACGFLGAVHIYDETGVLDTRLPADETQTGEVVRLMWGPHYGERDAPPRLYIDLGATLLCTMPNGTRFGAIHSVEYPFPDPEGLARDDAGGLAMAKLHDEYHALTVSVLDDVAESSWTVREGLEAPDSYFGCEVALAGRSVAVCFEGAGVWVTRDFQEQDFREVEEMRPRDPLKHGVSGGCMAFEGSTSDAALFCARMVSDDTQAILRLDSNGRVERIADVVRSGESTLEPIRQMAWDASRRALWCACEEAGLLCVTPPGVRIPVGAEGATTAPS
jgi:hypothetical protein